MKRHLIEAVVLGIVLTLLSYGVAFWMGWATAVNYLEVFAVFTSYGSTWLCVRQRRYNYIFGAISTAAYALLFFQFGLYGSALVNLYLCPTLLYGWFRWGRDEVTRPVQHVQLRWLPVYLLFGGLIYLAAVLTFGALGATLPLADSLILAATVVAQLLLDNKKIETWYVWAVVNVAAIFVYAAAGLPLASIQYVFFLANTVIGYFAWNRSMNESVGTPVLVEADEQDLQAPDVLEVSAGQNRPGDQPAVYDFEVSVEAAEESEGDVRLPEAVGPAQLPMVFRS